MGPAVVSAALTWDAKTIEVTPKPGDAEAVGLFRFKNAGTTAVKIRDVRSSCDCTTAELGKRDYAPGEEGTIRAIFTIGDRMGLQEKGVTVITDDPTNPMINLTLKVSIPELLSYSSRMLYWKAGGENNVQAITIKPLGGNRISAIEVRDIASQQATVRVEKVEAGTQFRLVVKPVAVDQPRTTLITLVAQFEGGAQHSFTVFALVR